LAEVSNLSANLGNVAVGSAGQYPRSGGVLLAGAHLLGQLGDLRFQRGHARFQLVRCSHAQKGTDYRPVCSVPILVAQLHVARPSRAGDIAVGDLTDLAGVWAQGAFGKDGEAID
jgi:hypothetical protein